MVAESIPNGGRRVQAVIHRNFAGDLAVIGTRFGQKGTPGWYYNLRADPLIKVAYQGKSTAAVAREVQGDEWQAIWERARHIYGGYEAYARRIKGRPIRIMLLSMQITSAGDTG